ncbi:Hsp70 family protein [Photobacterium sp. 1_MG-2023]|uniref:Hsp70 family protein n=1 Tax=Photobacterium sp. 1_MG-2023 TaxID=3062646 RepID=UPI0026E4824F|nr:Hsp70 family protein [Photobacterium sp. 1_MG-2023]MDO6705605.1 Hsp70 family protein [Photobacterium sp. 1_MG-2023]
MSTNKHLAIGIDLGTTNSAIAVWRDGQAELIPNALGHFLTPSVVSIDEQGQVLVGEAAQSRLLTRPQETAAAFKRFLGTEKTYLLGQTRYTPAELCALILQSLKADAEAHLGEAILEVVISVPAYFSDQQRKQVHQAAELAGLIAVRLINEPTAACLAYSLHETHERRFLVFDLGGGTFDVTVVEHQDGFVDVHASAGDNQLGGEDFTRQLAAYVIDQLKTRESDLSLSDRAKIFSACEAAKKNQQPEMTIVLPEPFNTQFTLTPIQLEDIWKSTLLKLSQPLRRALSDARISTDQIDELIFVGGATRLRQVQQLATRLIGRFGQSKLDPDQVVAMGAATQAACRLRDQAVQEIVLTDVSPFSLGIAANRNGQVDVFSPIIERNTVIPTSRVERFNTAYDQQDKVRIAVYQGERFWARENIFITEFEIEVPPNRAGEEAIDVRFSYDINGLLEVDVTILSTNAKVQQVIDRTPVGLSEADKRASQERLAQLKTHPRDQLPNIALTEKLNRLYEEKLGYEREMVEHLILQFTQALDSQNQQIILDAKKEVEVQLKHWGFS